MVAPISAEEALSRLDSDERRWLETFRDEVRARWGERIRDVRLFGSRARGERHDESDIDVLVLVDDLDFDTKGEIVSMAARINARLSAAVYDFDGYHSTAFKGSGFYKEMRKESVRL